MALWRPYREKLRARISLAQNELSPNFPKLSSQWGVGVASAFPTQWLPLPDRFSQDIDLQLPHLSRKSGGRRMCFFLLLYIQKVPGPLCGVRHPLPQRFDGLNTCDFGPLFAEICVCLFEILPTPDFPLSYFLYLLRTTKLWLLFNF